MKNYLVLLFLVIVFSACQKSHDELINQDMAITTLEKNYSVEINFDKNVVFSSDELNILEEEIRKVKVLINIGDTTFSNAEFSSAAPVRSVFMHQRVYNAIYLNVHAYDDGVLESFISGVTIYQYTPYRYTYEDLGMGEVMFSFHFTLSTTVYVSGIPINVTNRYRCNGLVYFSRNQWMLVVTELN